MSQIISDTPNHIRDSATEGGNELHLSDLECEEQLQILQINTETARVGIQSQKGSLEERLYCQEPLLQHRSIPVAPKGSPVSSALDQAILTSNQT